MKPSAAVLRRLGLSVVIAACLVGIGFGFSIGGQPRTPTRPAAIARYSPVAGDLDLRQAIIGIAFAPGYTGTISEIDGRTVPDDDLHRVDALRQVTFNPRTDSDFRRPGPGFHRVTALYWRINETPDQALSWSWTFRLH